ncbi:M20 family metallopeptidase [Ferviditalea candida]|uniref:M20 family metallopeptidase n=1 Tax=Ferviditalea candida TaxID=3108399 RepID=A0ABU5ZMX5_9BACL|nr:M20 family metallopeptidase [Paenibacillaceae bacterium T2]
MPNSMKQREAVEFLQRLIQINSVNPPGNERWVADVIAERAKKYGLDNEIIRLDENRANIIVRLKGSGSKPALVFSGHLDTVPAGENPWIADPFSGEEIDGKIYGRGASDMKSGVAAMIEAMISLHAAGAEFPGDIIFAGTAGEEVDCLGAQAFMDENVFSAAGAIVIGEPTSGEVFIAHKGALWLEITTYGKTAHGSMPDQGINAIVHMNQIINRLQQYSFSYAEKHQLLGEPTLNISTISGGIKTNVVPDRCVLTVDIRTIPEMEHKQIFREIKAILEELEAATEHFRAEIRVVNDRQSISTDRSHPLVDTAVRTNQQIKGHLSEPKGVNYYTDGSVFAPATGLPIIIYGPGDEKLAHQPDEYVEIDKYLESIQYYAKFARNYFENQ